MNHIFTDYEGNHNDISWKKRNVINQESDSSDDSLPPLIDEEMKISHNEHYDWESPNLDDLRHDYANSRESKEFYEIYENSSESDNSDIDSSIRDTAPIYDQESPQNSINVPQVDDREMDLVQPHEPRSVYSSLPLSYPNNDSVFMHEKSDYITIDIPMSRPFEHNTDYDHINRINIDHNMIRNPVINEVRYRFPNSSYIMGPRLEAGVMRKYGSINMEKIEPKIVSYGFDDNEKRSDVENLESCGCFGPLKTGIIQIYNCMKGLFDSESSNNEDTMTEPTLHPSHILEI